MYKTDICIVGNGSIGIMAALELHSTFPDKKISLVGPSQHTGSASLAAGAMHAVYGEIEGHFQRSMGDQKQFELALKSKESWSEYFKKFGNAAKTAKDTIIYLRDSKNPFEVANYQKAVELATENNVSRPATRSEIKAYLNLDKYEAVDVITDEFAFCPITIFNQNKQFLRKSPSVDFIDDKAVSIDKKIVKTARGEEILSEIFIVCNGAATSQLLSEKGVLPIYQGVGTAMSISSSSLDYGSDFVVRTVNRGGTQCGVHIVPRSDGTHYIGAGNYLAEFDDRDDHRIETVRYLTEVAESEIIGRKNTYDMRGKLLLGKRARSFDGWPLFGPLSSDPNIIVASGWNRVGFTLSTLVAKEIVNIIRDDKIKHISGWAADRDPISFGSKSECAEFYASSRCANMIEHKLLQAGSEDYQKKFDELKKLSFLKNKQIVNKLKLPKDFGVHPDLYGLLSSG